MRIASILRFAGAIVAAALFVGAAHAQLFRAYLAPTGLDTNPCTLSAPCRLLPAALAAVVDGGEIWMLGSANYNAATVDIDRSVSILAVPGALGSLVATGGPAISIATAGVRVSLRNLVIAPLSGATGDGIEMIDGISLTVDNCLIANLVGTGINVSTPAKVRIVDSLIRDNVFDGVHLDGGATADISGTRLLGNGNAGVFAHDTAATTITTAVISDCVLSGNRYGLDAFAPIAGAFVHASVSRSTISNNLYGIISDSNSVVTISDNLVTTNGFGLYQANAATLESPGNNTVRQNDTADTFGAIAAFADI